MCLDFELVNFYTNDSRINRDIRIFKKLYMITQVIGLSLCLIFFLFTYKLSKG